MMKRIQRFGGAMFTPTLLFAFAGIMVGFSAVFKNKEILGALAMPDTIWYKFWDIISAGSWTVFFQLPVLFALALPIALAKKQQARACMEALVTYLTFNYFLNKILFYFGANFGVDMETAIGQSSGLTMIAGIKTLDTGMIGALLISGVVIYIHNRYYDVELPDAVGIFSGSSLVVAICFFLMLPLAFLTAAVWPKVQIGMRSMQGFFIQSGNLGIWIYSFLERILIPTGLHHFIYSPFAYDNAIVQGGTAAYWALHLEDFATNSQSLKEMFPVGFSLSGMSKVFGSLGVCAAFYKTSRPENRKRVLGLMIPVTLTAAMTGITEPLEFTFLFIAPVLFLVHAILSATVATIAFAFGVVGNFGGGIINWLALNWIPLGKYHYVTYIIQVVIGLIFAVIWYFVFVLMIEKMDLKTPGREADNGAMKLYSKHEYLDMKDGKEVQGGKKTSKAAVQAACYMEAVGGRDNVVDVTNCATRLRLTIKNPDRVAPAEVFKQAGAHGLVNNGTALQIIVGLSVAQVRDEFEALL